MNSPYREERGPTRVRMPGRILGALVLVCCVVVALCLPAVAIARASRFFHFCIAKALRQESVLLLVCSLTRLKLGTRLLYMYLYISIIIIIISFFLLLFPF